MTSTCLLQCLQRCLEKASFIYFINNDHDLTISLNANRNNTNIIVVTYFEDGRIKYNPYVVSNLPPYHYILNVNNAHYAYIGCST